MRKANPMRILVAFGALSQVGGEAFEDSGANRSSIARVWHLLAGGIAMAKMQSAGGRCCGSNR